MKNILYTLILLSIFACNNKPKENATTVIPSPNDVKGLKNNGKTVQDAPVLIFNPPHGKPGHDCSIAEGEPLT